MDKMQNPSANANWAAPAKPMVPKIAPPAAEQKPDLMRPTGWSPTAWRFSKDGGQ